MNTATKADPYTVSCSVCDAPVGFNCTYVHPRDWTSRSQRRFFNEKSIEEQVKLLRRAGDYIDQPHLVRFRDAREALEDKLTAEQSLLFRKYPSLAEWNYTSTFEPPLTASLNGQKFYSQTYIDKLLADARQEWETDRAWDLNEAMDAVIAAGKRMAMNLIATGSENG